MKILIVFAHPEPRSMNGALFSTAVQTLTAAGHEVKTSDLYAMSYDPVSDRRNFTTVQNPDFYKQQLEELHAVEHQGFSPEVEAEQQKVEWCDLMIWQFPLWWFSMPAILKGWVDRTFAMGRFYKRGSYYEEGIFKGKKALLSVTTGSDAFNYQKEGVHGDVDGILRSIHRGMLHFTGFGVLQPYLVYGPARMTPEMRADALEGWRNRLDTIFEEPTVDVGRY